MKNLSGCKGMLCGRTPVLWEKKMSLAITRLNDLRRDSSWIEGWVAGVKLKLCQESLTGSCLAELVGSASVGEDSGLREHSINNGSITAADTFSFIRDAKTDNSYGSASLSDSRAKYSTSDMLPEDDQSADHRRWIDLPGGYNRWHSTTYKPRQQSGIEAVRSSISSGSSSFTSEKTRKLMPGVIVSGEVNRDLLTHLAGVLPSLEVNPQNRLIIWPSMPNKAVSSIHFENTLSHQSWLGKLADTAAQSLYRKGMEQIPAVPMSDHQICPDTATYLESQWRTGLSGFRAPSNLLAAIFAKASIISSKANRFDQTIPKHSLTEPAGVDQSDHPFVNTPGHVPSDRYTELVLGLDNLSLLSPDDQKLSGSKYGQIRAVIDPVRHSNKDSQISQSTDSTLFPSLPSPHEAYGGSNQKGLVSSEEDIASLAVKIKQILDDEARRYGINV